MQPTSKQRLRGVNMQRFGDRLREAPLFEEESQVSKADPKDWLERFAYLKDVSTSCELPTLNLRRMDPIPPRRVYATVVLPPIRTAKSCQS